MNRSGWITSQGGWLSSFPRVGAKIKEWKEGSKERNKEDDDEEKI